MCTQEITPAEIIKQKIEETGKFSSLVEIHGGMNAYAYKAHHIPLNINVFLKIYEIDLESQNIFWEAESLAQVITTFPNVSHIARVYDAEIIDEYVLISMEFISGTNLLDKILTSSLGLMDSVSLCIKILSGLSQLHQMNYIHRDLKPANIMLDDSDNTKISDFGSVSRLKDKEKLLHASKHSALYRPHEAWSDNKYGKQSDIYQVGVILYEMINGNLAYNNERYIDQEGSKELKKANKKFLDLDDFEQSQFIDKCLARRVSSSTLLPLCCAKSYYAGKIKKIVNKATAKDYASRYQSAGEFQNALLELKLPNWKQEEEKYIVHNWQGYQWEIIYDEKKQKWVVIRIKIQGKNRVIYAEDKNIGKLFASIGKVKK